MCAIGRPACHVRWLSPHAVELPSSGVTDGVTAKGRNMAERVIRQLIDDIDGSEITDGGGERVEFSLRGVDYKIDLSTANVTKLEKALKPYVVAAMKVRSSRGARPKAGANRSGSAATEQLTAIREWARKNGHQVSERGRIKAEVVEAFKAAH